MGPKGAPGYFQQQLATYVLRSLLNVRCELFLDDIYLGSSQGRLRGKSSNCITAVR